MSLIHTIGEVRQAKASLEKLTDLRCVPKEQKEEIAIWIRRLDTLEVLIIGEHEEME